MCPAPTVGVSLMYGLQTVHEVRYVEGMGSLIRPGRNVSLLNGSENSHSYALLYINPVPLAQLDRAPAF